MAEAVGTHDRHERARTTAVGLTQNHATTIDSALGLPAEFGLADAARLNTLVVGPPDVITRVLGTLGHRFEVPILTSRGCLSLQRATTARTLIIDDIDRLSLSDQCELMKWMEQVPSCPRIISTASGPLLTALADGAFLADLYYRLNTVYVDLGGPRASAPVVPVGST